MRDLEEAGERRLEVTRDRNGVQVDCELIEGRPDRVRVFALCLLSPSADFFVSVNFRSQE